MKIDVKSASGRLRQYPVLCSACLVFILLATWAFYRSDAIAEQKAEYDKYFAEGNRYRANTTNGAQLQQQLDFLIEANKAIEKRAFRSSDSLAPSLQYFYRMESEIGVKYLDLRPNTRPAPAGASGIYTPINYTVGVSGDFQQIIAFLRALAQGPYFSRINSASITGKGNATTLSIDLDLLGIQ